MASLPACAHPLATVVDLYLPSGGGPLTSSLPCAWPGCTAGIEDHEVELVVPGHGVARFRRERRAGRWVWAPTTIEQSGPLEASIVATLTARGPCAAWRLAEVLGVSVDRVLPLLRDLKTRGLVTSEPDGQGVRTWRRS